jgi:hypothetical protein
MPIFDYTVPAQLYYPQRPGKSAPLNFDRFETSAEAIKYAVEHLTPFMLHGAILEIEEDRFGSSDIQQLYEDNLFPLERRQR